MSWKARLFSAWLAVAIGGGAAAQTVTIGAEDDWFPYSGLIDGKVQGITLDVVRAAYAVVGLEVRYEVMPYARCLAQTRAGILVACFNTLRNAAIEDEYLWHKPAMFPVQYKIYARAESIEQNLKPKDLEGRRVAVTHAYEYGAEFDDNSRIQRVYSPRDESNFRMLLLGRADFTLALEINTRMLIQRRPDLAGRIKMVGAVAESGVYMAFSRAHADAPRLMARFEEGLRIIGKNGRLQAIHDEWWLRLVGSKADPVLR
ncbi:transporter substrate-binding domain-containing protein [Pelomonas sp. SE-A7]|uniref:substrate-binding periplasmic protein n=1 Tax=Pelomonas sp. SE-A7 TaxID=3054953 RepID=UPI00259D1AAD|nr:transporter substrate-binding domain-containing protein [Pelomonas sp. SE-A7]MDM4764790.1 transporter substrate-binding domain-containing protein [Pelomonas sp. SE-A7]